jgi:hypothetical protein
MEKVIATKGYKNDSYRVTKYFNLYRVYKNGGELLLNEINEIDIEPQKIERYGYYLIDKTIEGTDK